MSYVHKFVDVVDYLVGNDFAVQEGYRVYIVWIDTTSDELICN